MRTMGNEYKFSSPEWCNTKNTLGAFMEKENKEKQDFCVAFLSSICEQLKAAEDKIYELEHRTEEDRVEELKEEIEELKNQNIRLKNIQNLAFSADEDKKISLWYNQHLEEVKNKGDWRKRINGYHHLTYTIDYFPIGIIKAGVCKCGASIHIYDDGSVITDDAKGDEEN